MNVWKATDTEVTVCSIELNLRDDLDLLGPLLQPVEYTHFDELVSDE
jgi:hypothetical protein